MTTTASSRSNDRGDTGSRSGGGRHAHDAPRVPPRGAGADPITEPIPRPDLPLRSSPRASARARPPWWIAAIALVIVVTAALVAGVAMTRTTTPMPMPMPPAPVAAAPSALPSAPSVPPARVLAAGDIVVPTDGRAVAGDEGTFGRGGVVGDEQVLAMISYQAGGGPASVPMTLATYDEQGTPLAQVVDPPWLDDRWLMTMARRADGTSVLWGIAQHRVPAQGVVPEQITYALTAADARTLRPLWTLPLRPRATDTPNIDAFSGSTPTTYPSQNGRWVLSTFSEPPVLLDAASGRVVRQVPDAIGLVGNTLIVKPNRWFDPHSVRFLDPASGAVRGETSDPDVVRGFGSLPDQAVGAMSTVDGSRLVVVANGAVVALRAADAGVAWRRPSDPGATTHVVVDPRSGTVLATRSDTVTGETVGLDPATGRERWRQPTANLCGVVDGRAAAEANGQLATLDAATGRQLGFDPQRSQCPMLITGGYSYDPARGVVRYW